MFLDNGRHKTDLLPANLKLNEKNSIQQHILTPHHKNNQKQAANNSFLGCYQVKAHRHSHGHTHTHNTNESNDNFNEPMRWRRWRRRQRLCYVCLPIERRNLKATTTTTAYCNIKSTTTQQWKRWLCISRKSTDCVAYASAVVVWVGGGGLPHCYSRALCLHFLVTHYRSHRVCVRACMGKRSLFVK